MRVCVCVYACVCVSLLSSLFVSLSAKHSLGKENQAFLCCRWLFCSSLQERDALKVVLLKEIHKVQECKQRSVKVNGHVGENINT